jgi:hypothetical protein
MISSPIFRISPISGISRIPPMSLITPISVISGFNQFSGKAEKDIICCESICFYHSVTSHQ